MKDVRCLPLRNDPRNTESSNNYYPCVVRGETTAIAPFTRAEWQKIAWEVFVDDGKSVLMQCYFYTSDTEIDARATFNMNVKTGWITDFMFENVKGIPSNGIRNIASANVTFERSKAAFRDARRLSYYFKRVNDIELQKAQTPVTVINANKFGFAAQFSKKTSTKPNVEKVYDPNVEKAPKYINSTESTKARNYTVEEWYVRGHYRRTRNGKEVFIKPTIRKRHR